MVDTIINEQAAQEQIDMWLDSYNYSIKNIRDNKAREQIEQACEDLKKDIMAGFVSIENEGGKVVVKQNLEFDYGEYIKSPIIYAELTAGKKKAINVRDDDNMNKKIIITMDALSNVSHPNGFDQLRAKDLARMEKIGVFFCMF